MKIIGILSQLIISAKRVGIGATDVVSLFKAIKKNKADSTVTPEGQIEYQRLAGFVTTMSIIVLIGLHSFGAVEVETFNNVIDELFKLLKTLN